jgi:hypothetical protein
VDAPFDLDVVGVPQAAGRRNEMSDQPILEGSTVILCVAEAALRTVQGWKKSIEDTRHS